jgi:uncharacterized protein YndB with AHSA1/START domain
MSITSTDRIEKRIMLKAPATRVWSALTDPAAFGEWFGVRLTGTFTPGARLSGRVTYPGYEHVPFEITVERMESERLVSWRWHPNAIEEGMDYGAESTTLVEFALDPVDGGTILTVTESGFDGIPLSRRAEAYRGNDEGWTQQVRNIERYLAGGD